MNLTAVRLEDAELGKDYWVELRGWDEGGVERRPCYRARIADKGYHGTVKLDREIMGPLGRGNAWDVVEHQASDLFIYEMPYEPTDPGPDESGTSRQGGEDSGG